jgi:menaquinone-dependent protoporphyrinogen oxidase
VYPDPETPGAGRSATSAAGLRRKEELAVAAHVLVAYATKMGSTKEVAEAVADALRGAGREVEFAPLREVRTLEGLGLIVIGAPLYMFKWHKEARGFLARFRQALAGLPCAVFALGPFEDTEKDWKSVRENFDKELARFPWFSPAVREVFGGAFDPAKLSFPYNLVPGLKKMPAKDIRDWDAIRAWAQDLAGMAAAAQKG